MCFTLKFNNPFLVSCFLFLLIILSYDADCKNIRKKEYLKSISDTSSSKEINIEEVVISAQITPKKIGDAVHDVQIISRQMIDKLASNNLYNLLNLN